MKKQCQHFDSHIYSLHANQLALNHPVSYQFVPHLVAPPHLGRLH